jgi:hypothetical protein
MKILLIILVILCPIFLNAQNKKDSLMQDPNKVVVKDSDGKIITVIDVEPVPIKELKISKGGLPELTFESILDVMKLQYDSVKGFLLNKNFELCRPYSLALHNSIKSTDDNFMVFMEIYFTGTIMVFEDDKTSVDYIISEYNRFYGNLMNMYAGARNSYITPRISMEQRNIQYFYTVRNHLINIAKKYGEDYRNNFTIQDLKKHVHYFSDSYAKTKFNADTVISYTLPVQPVNGDRTFKKKYSKCEVFMLQKNDIGPVFFYCFYTKKGYKKRSEYMEKLEQAFEFKD